MSRLLVFALIASLGNTSVVFAGETLLESATRLAQEVARTQPSPPASGAQAKSAAPGIVQAQTARQHVNLQQGQPGLQSAGVGKRSKLLIAAGAAAAFVGVALAIDATVEDNTPSSRGDRPKRER